MGVRSFVPSGGRNLHRVGERFAYVRHLPGPTVARHVGQGYVRSTARMPSGGARPGLLVGAPADVDRCRSIASVAVSPGFDASSFQIRSNCLSLCSSFLFRDIETAQLVIRKLCAYSAGMDHSMEHTAVRMPDFTCMMVLLIAMVCRILLKNEE